MGFFYIHFKNSKNQTRFPRFHRIKNLKNNLKNFNVSLNLSAIYSIQDLKNDHCFLANPLLERSIVIGMIDNKTFFLTDCKAIYFYDKIYSKINNEKVLSQSVIFVGKNEINDQVSIKINFVQSIHKINCTTAMNFYRLYGQAIQFHDQTQGNDFYFSDLRYHEKDLISFYVDLARKIFIFAYQIELKINALYDQLKSAQEQDQDQIKNKIKFEEEKLDQAILNYLIYNDDDHHEDLFSRFGSYQVYENQEYLRRNVIRKI